MTLNGRFVQKLQLFYNPKKMNRAFTIIEMIVTLLIAGILISIATVSYGLYKNKMRLAEAAITLDALTKSQVSFYLTHKHFVSFFVPGLYYGVIPSGTKVAVDSSIPSSVVAPNNTVPWDSLGKPLQDGTMISFLYESYAGSNNSAGQALTGTHDFSFISYVSSGSVMVQWMVANPQTSKISCIVDLGTTQAIANQNIPDKNWVVMTASANFSDSVGENWVPMDGVSGSPQVGLCTQIQKYIETDNRGNVAAGFPLSVQNLGN